MAALIPASAQANMLVMRINAENTGGISAMENGMSLQIMPNPASEILTIKGINISDGYVRIIDSRGVLFQHILVRDAIMHVNVSGLPSGRYYLQVGKRVSRFVKM